MSSKLHLKFGTNLKKVRNYLMAKLSEYNTKKEYHQSKEKKALKHLEILRNILDDLAARDFSNFDTKWYYGDVIDEKEKNRDKDIHREE